jgi:transcriptional regulator with XRE-family HTH domain
MTIGGTDMKDFRRAKKVVDVSVWESVRIVRKLQGYSQNELARFTGTPQATLSAIENDRVRLRVDRAKVIATALKCHPAVLVFPGWEFGMSQLPNNKADAPAGAWPKRWRN